LDLDDDPGFGEFLEDEAFADTTKKQKWVFSMTFPGLRRSLSTCLLIVTLVGLAFFAGYEVNAVSGHIGDDDKGRSSSDVASSNVDVRDLRESPQQQQQQQEGAADGGGVPRCGSEFTVAGGTGFGGHNLAKGCVNAGRMTWSMCLQAVQKRSGCSAATYKEHECWLHDRHMPVSVDSHDWLRHVFVESCLSISICLSLIAFVLSLDIPGFVFSTSICRTGGANKRETWLTTFQRAMVRNHVRFASSLWFPDPPSVKNPLPQPGVHKIQSGGLVGPQQDTTLIVRLTADLDQCRD
jgi:hypothetical protein